MKSLPLLCCVLMLSSNLAFGCEKPLKPELPDPDRTITAHMIKAKNDMEDYLQAAQAYLKCAESDQQGYQSMLSEMHQVAEQFTLIIRKYKERREV